MKYTDFILIPLVSELLSKMKPYQLLIKTYFKNTSIINVHIENFYFKQPYNSIKLSYFLNYIAIESYFVEQ